MADLVHPALYSTGVIAAQSGNFSRKIILLSRLHQDSGGHVALASGMTTGKDEQNDENRRNDHHDGRSIRCREPYAAQAGSGGDGQKGQGGGSRRLAGNLRLQHHGSARQEPSSRALAPGQLILKMATALLIAFAAAIVLIHAGVRLGVPID
jgi:hypothetical protein